MASLEEIFARLQHSEETTRIQYNPLASLNKTSSNLPIKPKLDGTFKVPQLDEVIYKQPCNDVIDKKDTKNNAKQPQKSESSANVNPENDASRVSVEKEVRNSQQAGLEIDFIGEKKLNNDKQVQLSSSKDGGKLPDDNKKQQKKNEIIPNSKQLRNTRSQIETKFNVVEKKKSLSGQQVDLKIPQTKNQLINNRQQPQKIFGNTSQQSRAASGEKSKEKIKSDVQPNPEIVKSSTVANQSNNNNNNQQPQNDKIKISNRSTKDQTKSLTTSNKLENLHRQPQSKKYDNDKKKPAIVPNTDEPQPGNSRDLLKLDKPKSKFDVKPTTARLSRQPAQRTTKLSDGSASKSAMVNPIDYHTQLSKMLFYILMHLEEYGLQKSDDEFIDVDKILNLPLMVKKRCNIEDIKQIVCNQNDTNYGRFKLLMDNSQKFKIKVNFKNNNRDRKRDTSPKTAQRNTLLHVLRNPELLNVPKTETGFYDVSDVLKEPTVVKKSIKVEDIERILDDPEDFLYGKFIFVRYESGRCRIKENPTFTKGYRKVKVKYAGGNFTERELTITKSISFLLRHNSEGLEMSDEGFVELKDLLMQPKIAKLGCTFEDIKKLLTMDEYARYSMVEYEPDLYKVKAAHGHSIRRIMDWNFANWREVTNLPVLVHMCTYPTWLILRKNGFEKTRRATFNAFDPDDVDFVRVREINIFLDAEQARKDGAKFYIVPENNIIITEGLEGGLAIKYFIKAVDVATGDLIKFR